MLWVDVKMDKYRKNNCTSHSTEYHKQFYVIPLRSISIISYGRVFFVQPNEKILCIFTSLIQSDSDKNKVDSRLPQCEIN